MQNRVSVILLALYKHKDKKKIFLDIPTEDNFQLKGSFQKSKCKTIT